MRLEKFEIGVIEELWSNYEINKKQVQQREFELSQKEENPSENPFIKYYSMVSNAIEKLYSELDEDLKVIVDMRYWNKSGIPEDYEVIADRLFMSRSRLLKKRKLLIEKTAKEIGWA